MVRRKSDITDLLLNVWRSKSTRSENRNEKREVNHKTKQLCDAETKDAEVESNAVAVRADANHPFRATTHAEVYGYDVQKYRLG